MPLKIMPNTLNEEDIDLITEEIVTGEKKEKSDVEIKIYASIEELQ